MQIKSLDFLLTFKCNSQCKHCSYKAGPEMKGFIKSESIKKYLFELEDTHPLQSITVHGGEPFLYFKQLKYALEKGKELGIPRRGTITNGYWAENPSIAKKKLRELKDVGLTQITFSADSFHQEYIPLNRVKTAITSAVTLAFENIWVDSYFLEDFEANNPFNDKTREIVNQLEEIQNIEINKYLLGYEGRGSNLTKYVKLKTEIPSGKCPLPFWIGGDLTAPTTVEIDYEGNITLCPGISIGNTNNKPLDEILQDYECSSHPILSRIADKGPIGLVELAEEKNCLITQPFADECHVCYEMRKLLRSFYPQYLAPSNCYQSRIEKPR